MAAAPIDYAALAKQAGAISSTPPPAKGPIDYAALARQAGAISSTPAPAQKPQLDTSNPNGEGTYRMVGQDGSSASVPFSKVRSAQNSGYAVTDGAESARYANDAKSAPGTDMMSRLAGYGNAMGTAQIDLLKGAGEGLVSTVSGANGWATKHLPAFMTTPIGQAATPENQARGAAYTKQLATPTNTMQKVGKFGEQAAEFMIPGEAEEHVLAGGLKVFPQAAKVAPLLKAGLAALASGAVNKTQGGTFAGGAGASLFGSGAGAVLKAVAPSIAETALRVRGADRAYGATPGRAILDETTGLRPSSVVDSARESLNDLQNQQAAALHGSPGLVPLTPTRNIGLDAEAKAIGENHPGTMDKLQKLNTQLQEEAGSGNPIPADVTPARAAALNRGLANAKTSWNPQTTNSSMSAAAGSMHHQLAGSIADVVPEIKPLNQRVQSLMPVVQRGTMADLNAGPVQRMVGRLSAPTGALLGAGAGYHYGGVTGGLLGFAVPELLASPEAQMGLARGANAAGKFMGGTYAPAAVGAGMQLARPGDDASGANPSQSLYGQTGADASPVTAMPQTQYVAPQATTGPSLFGADGSVPDPNAAPAQSLLPYVPPRKPGALLPYVPSK